MNSIKKAFGRNAQPAAVRCRSQRVWEFPTSILQSKNGASLSIPEEKLSEISKAYHNRANQLGLVVDEKFRNLNGLKMQIGCIHYVVTQGKSGLSGASSLFYKTYELFRNEPARFRKIADDFHEKYYE